MSYHERNPMLGSYGHLAGDASQSVALQEEDGGWKLIRTSGGIPVTNSWSGPYQSASTEPYGPYDPAFDEIQMVSLGAAPGDMMLNQLRPDSILAAKTGLNVLATPTTLVYDEFALPPQKAIPAAIKQNPQYPQILAGLAAKAPCFVNPATMKMLPRPPKGCEKIWGTVHKTIPKEYHMALVGDMVRLIQQQRAAAAAAAKAAEEAKKKKILLAALGIGGAGVIIYLATRKK